MSIKPIKYQLEASLYSKKMTQLESTVAEQSQALLQFLFHYQDSPQKSQTGDLRLCERAKNSKTEKQESGQTVNGKRKKSRTSFISVSLSYTFKNELLQGCYAEIFKVTQVPAKDEDQLTVQFIYDSAPPDGDDKSGALVNPSAVELDAPAAEASAASLAARAASSRARSMICGKKMGIMSAVRSSTEHY